MITEMKGYIYIVLLLIPALLHAQQVKRDIRKGNKEFQDEHYNEAELLYREALDKESDSKPAQYNLANTLYKQKQFEPATTKYETLLGDDVDPATLAVDDCRLLAGRRRILIRLLEHLLQDLDHLLRIRTLE